MSDNPNPITLMAIFGKVIEKVMLPKPKLRKSTSRHIFQKVLLFIERGVYSVHFKEMNLL